MAKCYKRNHCSFKFDDKLCIAYRNNALLLKTHPFDNCYFLKFFPKSKRFMKENGFGNVIKKENHDWLINHDFLWKEISE